MVRLTSIDWVITIISLNSEYPEHLEFGPRIRIPKTVPTTYHFSNISKSMTFFRGTPDWRLRLCDWRSFRRQHHHTKRTLLRRKSSSLLPLIQTPKQDFSFCDLPRRPHAGSLRPHAYRLVFQLHNIPSETPPSYNLHFLATVARKHRLTFINSGTFDLQQRFYDQILLELFCRTFCRLRYQQRRPPLDAQHPEFGGGAKRQRSDAAAEQTTWSQKFAGATQ